MKKKMLLTGLAIGALLMIGVSVNSIHRTISENTDKYIMNEYIKENYGEECYGTLYKGNNDERIYFIVNQNGEDRYVTCINREYYTNKYR